VWFWGELYSWIAHCISLVRFSVLVIGNSPGFFSSCGLRWGDPLSPFLFVIVMEILSRMLSASVNGVYSHAFLWGLGIQLWLTFHIFCLLMIRYFFFLWAKLDHLHYLCALFLCFEAVSYLKINLAKSEMVSMGNVGTWMGFLAF
jgi:hypothetical protein